jgi:hypothetical protein
MIHIASEKQIAGSVCTHLKKFCGKNMLKQSGSIHWEGGMVELKIKNSAFRAAELARGSCNQEAAHPSLIVFSGLGGGPLSVRRPTGLASDRPAEVDPMCSPAQQKSLLIFKFEPRAKSPIHSCELLHIMFKGSLSSHVPVRRHHETNTESLTLAARV